MRQRSLARSHYLQRAVHLMVWHASWANALAVDPYRAADIRIRLSDEEACMRSMLDGGPDPKQWLHIPMPLHDGHRETWGDNDGSEEAETDRSCVIVTMQQLLVRGVYSRLSTLGQPIETERPDKLARSIEGRARVFATYASSASFSSASFLACCLSSAPQPHCHCRSVRYSPHQPKAPYQPRHRCPPPLLDRLHR